MTSPTRCILPLLLFCTFAISAPAQTQDTGISISNMDPAVRPGDNFYLYANGGFITRKDLTTYKTVERRPIRADYRGWQILGPPPPAA